MSEHEFWNAAQVFFGKSPNSHRRFIALFGIPPSLCAIVWNIIAAKQLHPNGSHPKHMLCALLFLKQYNTEEVNHAISGLDEKTFRKWQWVYVHLIGFQIEVVIKYWN